MTKWSAEGNIRAGGTQLETTTERVYLRQLVNMKEDLRPEIFRRNKLGRQAYAGGL